MGFYINPPPPDTKEEWLGRNGRATFNPEFPKDPTLAVVCMVTNKGQGFSAAAIAYSPAELKYFQDPKDERHKTWFYVSKAKLFELGAISPKDFQAGGL